MKGICLRCGEVPPKKLNKKTGGRINVSSPCPWCVKKIAPRSSQRPVIKNK